MEIFRLSDRCFLRKKKCMTGFLTGPFNTEQWLVDAEKVFSERNLDQISGSVMTLKSVLNELYVVYKENLKLY